MYDVRTRVGVDNTFMEAEACDKSRLQLTK